MCRRYVMSKATGDLLSHFEAKEVEGSPPPPCWNVAPTQSVPIVAERLDDGTIDRPLLIARWGLVPSWAKDIKNGSKLLCTNEGRTFALGSQRMASGRGMDWGASYGI